MVTFGTITKHKNNKGITIIKKWIIRLERDKNTENMFCVILNIGFVTNPLLCSFEVSSNTSDSFENHLGFLTFLRCSTNFEPGWSSHRHLSQRRASRIVFVHTTSWFARKITEVWFSSRLYAFKVSLNRLHDRINSNLRLHSALRCKICLSWQCNDSKNLSVISVISLIRLVKPLLLDISSGILLKHNFKTLAKISIRLIPLFSMLSQSWVCKPAILRYVSGRFISSLTPRRCNKRMINCSPNPGYWFSTCTNAALKALVRVELLLDNFKSKYDEGTEP